MLTKITEISGKTTTAEEITNRLGNTDVRVIGFLAHNKATERYVLVKSISGKEWLLPYYSLYGGNQIDDVDSLAKYIGSCMVLLSPENIEQFKLRTRRRLKQEFGARAKITLPIFRRFLNGCGEWIAEKSHKNSNSARRVEDIKERGYTIVTYRHDNETYRMMLPFDKVKSKKHETIDARLRKRIFSVLNNIDAFTGGKISTSSLPDHKFPEVRWDEHTAVSNAEMSDGEIIEKFQLVTERINQTKREVCRKCLQDGCRGRLNGIDYYYHGDERWPSHVPKMGAAAKVGCVGCFWYDMTEWRKQLNNLIKGCKEK